MSKISPQLSDWSITCDTVVQHQNLSNTIKEKKTDLTNTLPIIDERTSESCIKIR